MSKSELIQYSMKNIDTGCPKSHDQKHDFDRRLAWNLK